MWPHLFQFVSGSSALLVFIFFPVSLCTCTVITTGSVCLGQLSRNRSLGGDTSSQVVIPGFIYPKCPALAFSGSLTGNWTTCIVGYISEDNPQFSRSSTSVFLQCSLCQLSVDQSLFSFPSLTSDRTGTNPTWRFRSRSTSCSSSFFLRKLVVYILTLQGWFSPSRPPPPPQKKNYLPLDFFCSGCCVVESKFVFLIMLSVYFMWKDPFMRPQFSHDFWIAGLRSLLY